MIRVAPILFSGLALLWAGDAIRMRRRASALHTLPASDEPVAPSHRFLVRTGVTLDEATKRAASAYARANGLLVLDLVPRDLPAGRALFLLQTVDPPNARTDRLANAVSVGEAMLVDADVLERMRLAEYAVPDTLAMVKLARRLKQYATTTMDYAVAPTLHSAPEKNPQTRALIRFVFGDIVPPIVFVQLALALSGPYFAHIAGSIALAAMHLQAVLATLGTPLRPRGLFLQTLFRTVQDLASLLDPRGLGEPPPNAALVTRSRTEYAALLAPGVDRFFEPRRPDCPMCGGTALHPTLDVRDMFQRKPGRFHLERCDTCGHIFQNPRLTIEGLGFYYRDFYDGLGEDDLEAVFRSTVSSYRDRAKMVRDVLAPARWLDVGTGHAHFCNVAKDILPDTRFDGVDFTESIEEAQRRGWITKGYRALFPEVADQIGPQYDVVSMSHYLEHTRDPRAEIAAAAKVLKPGGALMVEVPDPDSGMGKILGRWWLPWFQPQHQHFVSARGLEKILRESGFEPAVWHRGEAHQVCDFFLAAAMVMHQVAPVPDRPWRKPSGALGRLWNRWAWFLSLPMLVVATLLDKILAPLLRRPGWSNTYRVVARRL